ncbi:hypothetical protein [Mycobacterium sp. MMS18-G62]
MGPSNLRLAAGVGVVAAVVMVGGPTASVAIADPGGSHSNRSDHRGGGDDRGGWKHGGDDRDGDRGDRGGSYGDNRDGGFGGDRDGGDRDYNGGGDRRADRNRWGDGSQWDGGDGQKSTSGSDSNQRSTSTSTSRSSTSSLAPQTNTGSQASDNSAPAPQTPADGPGSDTVSGADVSGPPTATAVEPPRVVVGNGRSPGIQTHAPEPTRPYFILPEIAPAPPPPPPIEIPPAPSDRVHPQRLVPQLAIAPSLDWTDPLWGLAGLIVIPAAGAVLGYRQAKATRDAEVLTRT